MDTNIFQAEALKKLDEIIKLLQVPAKTNGSAKEGEDDAER